MKLIMESWRKFLKEDTRAFHGFGMDPSKMRVPGCDGGEPSPADPDNQWTAKEKGCPKFSNDRNISSDHPDVVEALNFIEEKISLDGRKVIFVPVSFDLPIVFNGAFDSPS